MGGKEVSIFTLVRKVRLLLCTVAGEWRSGENFLPHTQKTKEQRKRKKRGVRDRRSPPTPTSFLTHPLSIFFSDFFSCFFFYFHFHYFLFSFFSLFFHFVYINLFCILFLSSHLSPIIIVSYSSLASNYSLVFISLSILSFFN